MPSSYEGFGIVYLEGMAFGLPALATTAGGAVEIITSGRDGFLISPGDHGALARHLGTLMADRDLLLTMSLAAQQRFAAHPTWEDAGAAVHRFLQSIMSLAPPKDIMIFFWEEGQGPEVPTLPPDPPPNPQRALERRASGATFQLKSTKGLGERVWERGQGSPTPGLLSQRLYSTIRRYDYSH